MASSSSSTEYTQVSYDSSQITNQDVKNSTDVLVDDINQLYSDMYGVGLTDQALHASTDKLASQSSDPYGSCWITLVTETMSLDCNVIAGIMVCMADVMNILSDVRNLFTLSQNSYMSMCSNADNPSYNNQEDMSGFEESLDVLNDMTFTVTNADGTTSTVTGGVIELLSTPDYWPNGKAPMSVQTADLLDTDIDGIEGCFSNWGDETSMWNQIVAWSVPTPDEDGIVTTNDTTSQINNNYSSMGDAIDSDTNKLTSELQVMMTEYQSFQDTWEQIMQYLADWNSTALQGMGA